MSVIKHLYIPTVDSGLTADYIIDKFYCYKLATINRVTLVPIETKTGIMNRAYIDVYEWYTTEVAYNFIQRLKDPNKETKFVHDDDNWWSVRISKKPYLSRCDHLKNYTTENYLVTGNSKLEFLDWLLINQHEPDDGWSAIEKELFDTHEYQNREYELCL